MKKEIYTKLNRRVPMRFKIILGILLSLVVIGSQAIADVTSYDNTFVANDVYSSDFHTRLNANFTRSLTGGINNITSANITDGTLASGDFSTAVSPITRTYEGAACEFVYTGLLPTTDADLSTDTSAGTAYPRGYRCVKSSATSHTYNASKWTYLDIDQNCDFQYTEVAINAADPAVASNAIRLARVSSDTADIHAVTDLRTTSCADGPFDNIHDVSTEASLEDLLANGSPIKNGGSTGWIQGLDIAWASHTSFTVAAGSAYINGKYRFETSATTITTTATDDPSEETSGIDAGVIAASTDYYVYAVADRSNSSGFSISYSTNSTAPAGVTNARKLGFIRTDGSSLFSSRDIVQSNKVNKRELVTSWVAIDMTKTGLPNAYLNGQNVAGLADMGVGYWEIVWDEDFTTSYPGIGLAGKYDSAGGNAAADCSIQRSAGYPSTSGLQIFCYDNSGSAIDHTYASVLAVGDK